MMSSLVLGVALAAPAAPVPRDTNPAPVGPAPWVLHLKADAGGRVMVMVYKTQKVTQTRVTTEVVDGKPVAKQIAVEVLQTVSTYVTLTEQDAKFATVAGTPVAADAVLKRAKGGLTVLVSADGKPVEKGWVRAVDPGTVVVAAEGLVGVGAPRPTVQVPTQAPRLAMLGTGTDGRVQVAYNPAAGGGYDDALVRGNRLVMLNNGVGVQQVFLNDIDGSYSPNPVPTAGIAPVKALADARFDAYDLTGKTVRREDALTRLKAGGLVLVSEDNRVPDESYLKLFRGDLLVLVSPELMNVPTGGKDTPALGPAFAAAPIQMQALPLVAPAVPAPVLVRPAVLRAAAIKPVAVPAKPVEQAPAPVEKGKR